VLSGEEGKGLQGKIRLKRNAPSGLNRRGLGGFLVLGVRGCVNLDTLSRGVKNFNITERGGVQVKNPRRAC